MKPQFSVIMATRNRPVLFEQALKSVLIQQDVRLEVIVVNDGSSEEYLKAYQELEKQYSEKVTFRYLPTSMSGHGQSYAINHGVLHASGEYVAFLDDDDYWTDELHLSRALKAFTAEEGRFEVYCARQEAWFKGKKETKPVWLERNLQSLTEQPSKTTDVYYASRESVVKGGTFSQVNIFILSRELYMGVGGFDENIRYECDREFFLRVLDKVEAILFANIYVSKHHIPDPDKTDNMSTAVKELTKLQYQLTLYTKLVLTCISDEVRTEAVAGQGYSLKHLSQKLVELQQYKAAARYAAMALGAQFTIKWLGYTSYLMIKALFSKR